MPSSSQTAPEVLTADKEEPAAYLWVAVEKTQATFTRGNSRRGSIPMVCPRCGHIWRLQAYQIQGFRTAEGRWLGTCNFCGPGQ
jgi:hypothetical protein